jgi:hypothetical protein
MEVIRDILMNPVKAILKAKKDRNMNKTLLILVISWIMVGISFSITLYRIGTPIIALSSALAIFLFGTLFSLFYGYIINVVMNVLGGKGKYYDGLTAATYSSLPISIGILVTTVLSFINVVLGGLLGFIALAITTALSLSIYFRAIKEFYSTDMVVTFVGFLVTIYVLMIAIYLSLGFSIGSSIFTMFPNQMM